MHDEVFHLFRRALAKASQCWHTYRKTQLALLKESGGQPNQHTEPMVYLAY